MKNDELEEKAILVTGGTGSFGRKFIDIMLQDYEPARQVVFSRDELKQHEMRAAGYEHPSLRYFIGDVRVWRSVSSSFLRAFIHRRFFGKFLLRLLYGIEEFAPRLLGRIGQYPMILFNKPALSNGTEG